MKRKRKNFDNDYFRYMMVKAGFTTSELAEKLDFCQKHINTKILSGQFTADEAITIAKLFGKKVEEIFKYEEDFIK